MSSDLDSKTIDTNTPIRYINIAIVGHVSNGKTTLVKALTEVNTKRNSEEKKSGRSIRLGYANCILWKCKTCKTSTGGQVFLTTGQKDKRALCSVCAAEMEIAHHISFVDAPGHHQYVQTMARGATVVDGAILVTDAHHPHVQVQTKEHLAILTILDVDNIVVVQNKIDLIDSTTCTKHYEMLKEYIKGTSAEKAPIIPLSAQSNLLVENLYPYLDDLCNVAKSKPIPDNKVFSIIRSFDINKPNTGVDDLKGGVLGGSVLGNTQFKIGDIVEIRPGRTDDRNHTPLTTKITSIFSESDSCKSITTGGLYGIGTTLDPQLTKADGIVGSLFGKPGDLPEVVSKLRVTVKHITLTNDPDKNTSNTTNTSNTEQTAATMATANSMATPAVVPVNIQAETRIKHDGVYKLLLGNNVVVAIAKKTEKKNMFDFLLKNPVCTVEKICLVYTNVMYSQLIAFGKIEPIIPVVSVTLVVPISTLTIPLAVPITTIAVVPVVLPIYIPIGLQSFDMYKSLLYTIEKAEQKRLTIPIPKLARENRNRLWLNVDDFCNVVKRTKASVVKFVSEETMLNMSVCANGIRMYKTNIDEKKLQSILKKFVIEHVACKQCKSTNTNLDTCLECHATRRTD